MSLLRRRAMMQELTFNTEKIADIPSDMTFRNIIDTYEIRTKYSTCEIHLDIVGENIGKSGSYTTPIFILYVVNNQPVHMIQLYTSGLYRPNEARKMILLPERVANGFGIEDGRVVSTVNTPNSTPHAAGNTILSTVVPYNIYTGTIEI